MTTLNGWSTARVSDLVHGRIDSHIAGSAPDTDAAPPNTPPARPTSTSRTGVGREKAGKAARNPWVRKPAEWFIFVFRGSPLFIQFFFAYFVFLSLKDVSAFFNPLTSAWAGALVVLFLNTAAYSGEIFYGALQSIPKGDTEAADAYGLSGWSRFRRVVWPTMLRLAWPAYTNEAIFLFHATTLVFFSGFPAWQQRGDALYYANFFADKTFNPFIAYPIVAGYFILLTLVIIGLFGLVNRRLTRHLPQERRSRVRYRPQLMR